ncbi:MAG: hypothetical protein ACLTYN_10935 [Dysosmobacter welbionis]
MRHIRWTPGGLGVLRRLTRGALLAGARTGRDAADFPLERNDALIIESFGARLPEAGGFTTASAAGWRRGGSSFSPPRWRMRAATWGVSRATTKSDLGCWRPRHDHGGRGAAHVDPGQTRRRRKWSGCSTTGGPGHPLPGL